MLKHYGSKGYMKIIRNNKGFMNRNNLSGEELRKITSDCRQATFLIEKQQMAEMSEDEEFRLALHVKGCEMCREYKIQSTLINRLAQKIYAFQSPEHGLSMDFKAGLQAKINEVLKDNIG